MENEFTGNIVLKPKHKGIIALYLLLPWILPAAIVALCVCLVGEPQFGSTLWCIVLYFLIIDGIIFFRFFFRKITILPGGKMRYDMRSVVFSNSHLSKEAMRFAQRNIRGQARFQGHYELSGRREIARKGIFFIQEHEEFHVRDIRKVGYTQKIYSRRYYSGWEKKMYKQYISVILANGKCMEWRLTGFRAADLEQFKAYIQKYNPDVKQYW